MTTSIQAMNIVRDTLRTYLTDPYITAGGKTTRTWIYTDEPLSSATFPRIQILKIDNPSEPISIGSEYFEYEQLYMNIYFYSKSGFKLTVSGTEYKDEQLVEYYLGLIKQTLKSQFNNMFNQGAKGYKHVNTTNIAYDEETQLYTGGVTVRVMYFNV